jgi:hypothetical protein
MDIKMNMNLDMDMDTEKGTDMESFNGNVNKLKVVKVVRC